jgi:putative membrane protein
VSLPRPGPAAAFTQWTPHPLMIAVSVVLAAGYVAGLGQLRRTGVRWPASRSVTFAIGLALLAWTGCGFLAVYQSSIYWAWTTRVLVLWLALPIVLLSGRPVELARLAGRGASVDRFLRSRPARVIANPLVGPALVPALSAVLFFGPVPGWSIGVAPFGWVLDVVLLVIGALMVLPLVGLDGEASSLAVGLSLAIGSFELVLDALPGIVLRLHTTIATSWFAHRDLQSWSPQPLRDQQVAGAILWCVAELIDLPFLVLVFRRWLRADARDAARVDAVLEAERAARRALSDGPRAASADAARTPVVERDAPWWESDPAMRERLRRQG